MAYERLDLIDENGAGTVGVYDSEESANTGAAPLKTYTVTATRAEGQSWYDALTAAMGKQATPAQQ